MKKIMILGASNTQVPLVRAAKELGYYTIVASIPGAYPAFHECDEIAYVDISKPEEVLAKAQELKIDGITTCCLDTGIYAVGYVAERMGLCNLSKTAAEMCNNKLKMKMAFEKNGVNTAKFRKANNIESLERVLEEFELPVVVKAVDLQGSKGVYIAKTKEEAISGFNNAIAETKEDFCIIEEYIEGHEFGAEAFVYQNKILFILTNGKTTYMSHTNVPIGHYVPLDMEESINESAVAETEKAIRAIGLDNCAVNVDLIEKNGRIYIIELTGRVGATCLPELVSIYYGIDYYKMIAMVAVGDNPLVEFNKKNSKHIPNASSMLTSETKGVIKSLKYDKELINEDVYDFSLLVGPGSKVNKFETCKDRIGQVIVKGTNVNSCKNSINRIKDSIKVELE